jgi:hypothetical protein
VHKVDLWIHNVNMKCKLQRGHLPGTPEIPVTNIITIEGKYVLEFSSTAQYLNYPCSCIKHTDDEHQFGV